MRKMLGVVVSEALKAGAVTAATKYAEKVGEAAGTVTVEAASWLRAKLSRPAEPVPPRTKRSPR